MIYYVKKGQQQGEWLTKPFVAVKHDDRKVVITPTRHRIVADVLPYAWKALSGGETVDGQGIYGRHPIYYKVRAKGGSLIQVARVGKNVMNRSDADEITATANGRWLTAERQDSEYIYFRVPANGGREVDVVMLYEDKGLHHHTNLAGRATLGSRNTQREGRRRGTAHQLCLYRGLPRHKVVERWCGHAQRHSVQTVAVAHLHIACPAA